MFENHRIAMTVKPEVTGFFDPETNSVSYVIQDPASDACAIILIATLLLTPYLYFLPHATLAATIIVAVLSLVDIGALKRTWDYSRGDFAAMAATIAVTLLFGVETGIVAGVATSIALHLWRTSLPHCAIVGQVPGTEHFRNVQRHEVCTAEEVITIRIDESLYFPNARFLEAGSLGLPPIAPGSSTSSSCARRSIISTPARWKAWRRSTAICATRASPSIFPR